MTRSATTRPKRPGECRGLRQCPDERGLGLRSVPRWRPRRLPVVAQAARGGSGCDRRRRDDVRDPTRCLPRRAARHRRVLERVGDEGTRRRDPVRGPHPRGARPARTQPRATRDGDGVDAEGGARRRTVHARHRGRAARRAAGTRAGRAGRPRARATRCRCRTGSPCTCSGSRPRTPTTSRAWRRS